MTKQGILVYLPIRITTQILQCCHTCRYLIWFTIAWGKRMFCLLSYSFVAIHLLLLYGVIFKDNYKANVSITEREVFIYWDQNLVKKKYMFLGPSSVWNKVLPSDDVNLNSIEFADIHLYLWNLTWYFR